MLRVSNHDTDTSSAIQQSVPTMPIFPHSKRVSPWGELHKKGGDLLRARLDEWVQELQYLKYRIAEWIQFGTPEQEEYYDFREWLLKKVGDHLHFELKV